jgi:hypothetical protein
MTITQYIWYPLVAIALGMAVKQSLEINDHMSMLRQEAPECTKTNPKKFVLLISTIVIQVLVQVPVMGVSRKLFMISLPHKTFPLGSKMRLSKADMLAERVYKLIIHTATLISMFFILKNSSYLHRNLLGDQDSVAYFANYPC